MKKAFYAGLAGLALFEMARVWLIMPLPGSQRIESLDAAYFLHLHRRLFRIPLLLLIASGSSAAFQKKPPANPRRGCAGDDGRGLAV